MSAFTADRLDDAVLDAGLRMPPFVVDQLVAAIDAGKHVILTGPPGTGKTTLAYVAAEVAQQAMMCTGYLPTTATSEWTTFETIGGLQPTAEGLIYRPGLFVDAIESGRWLVIDELNRSNFDRPSASCSPCCRARPWSCRSSARASPTRCRSSRPGSSRRRRPRSSASGQLADHRHHERVRQEPAVRHVVRAHAPVRLHRGGHPTRGRLPLPAGGSGRDRHPAPAPAPVQRPGAPPCTSTRPATRPGASRTTSASPASSTRSSTPTSCPSSRAWRTDGPPPCTGRWPSTSNPTSRPRAKRTIEDVLGVELAV